LPLSMEYIALKSYIGDMNLMGKVNNSNIA